MLLTKTEYLTEQQTQALVIIDSKVEAPEQLAAGIITNAEAIVLEPNRDSIAQITSALATGNYHSLHLISHGSPGCLHLGNTDLNSQTLDRYKQQIMEWGVAEILIYGCNVAIQTELLNQLHQLTGASIAASTEKVGWGNWDLKWQMGKIISEPIFKEELKREYCGTFAGFKPEATFATGNGSYSVAVGDFNGDNDLDLAVANVLNDNVSVLLGDGSGAFAPRTNFVVGSYPDSVAIGDLNEDGKLDFAVSNLGDDNISVRLGDGSGGFSSQTRVGIGGSGVKALAIGDLNGDGKLDLVAPNTDKDRITVRLGDGSGGFPAKTTFAVGDYPNSVAIGDLDGDGREDDLAVPSVFDNKIKVLLGDNSGGFTIRNNAPVGNSPRSVAIGDLDGDGREDDLAVVNHFSDNVSILLENGSGGFSRSNYNMQNSPISVAIGDLDEDGREDDIAVTNLGNNLSVRLGDNSGGFSAQTTFVVGDRPRSVVIADLDEDGFADDLITANNLGNNVSVLIECFLTGTHVLTQRGEVAVEDLAVGDLVQTKEGELEPVKWIGYQTIEPGSIRNTLRGNPVLVKAGALGYSLPTRDLYLSPDHSLLVDGLLINAGALVNDVSILQTEPTDTFVYHSIELDHHALLAVEGTYAESYMPQHEERLNYDNGAEYEQLYPHGSNLMLWPMDYPRVSSRTQVPRFVSEKLMKIAHQLGHAIEKMIA